MDTLYNLHHSRSNLIFFIRRHPSSTFTLLWISLKFLGIVLKKPLPPFIVIYSKLCVFFTDFSILKIKAIFCLQCLLGTKPVFLLLIRTWFEASKIISIFINSEMKTMNTNYYYRDRLKSLNLKVRDVEWYFLVYGSSHFDVGENIRVH